jgi:hypothetical protein
MTKPILLRALLILGLASCSAAGPTPRAAPPAAHPPARVLVIRDREGWTADYRFLRSSPVWVFEHSALTQGAGVSWRPGRWNVETRGVRLERHGRYDTLVAEGGGAVPDKVRLRFEPFTGGLVADYEPALLLGEAAVALFSDQFDVFPVRSTAEAAALPLDLGTAQIAERGTRVTFRDWGGLVFSQGARRPWVTLVNGRTYVLFGKADAVETQDIAAIIDPKLPEWLRGRSPWLRRASWRSMPPAWAPATEASRCSWSVGGARRRRGEAWAEACCQA